MFEHLNTDFKIKIWVIPTIFIFQQQQQQQQHKTREHVRLKQSDCSCFSPTSRLLYLLYCFPNNK